MEAAVDALLGAERRVSGHASGRAAGVGEADAQGCGGAAGDRR
jgi:hypothetical protein